MALPVVNTILYTTSLGKHTRPVFRQAVQQAIANDARIIMLHVVEPVGELGRALIQNYLPDDLVKKMHDEGINEIKKQMEARIAEFYQEELSSLPETPQLDIEFRIEEGNHADAILMVAEQSKADLIVMGNENRIGHHSHTPRQVNRQATVPVLVVPTGKKYQ